MKQLDQIVANDPLKLKKYDTGNGQSQSKMIYVFLVLIPIFLILTVVFWVFGSMTSTVPSSEPVTVGGNNPNDSTDND
jgi:hypothetical protein